MDGSTPEAPSGPRSPGRFRSSPRRAVRRAPGSGMDLDTYALRHPQLRPAVRMSPELVAALVRLRDGDVILDVGCGEGGTIAAISEQFPAQHCVGVDGSVRRSHRARAAGVTVLASDAAAMAIADDSVALVLNRHVIEHVPDDATMLREIQRVLRPGGLLYLETPLRLRGAWYPYRNPTGDRVLDPTHLREYSSPESVADLLAQAGLSCEAFCVRKLYFPLDEMTTKGLARVGLAQPRAERLGKRVPWRLTIVRYRELCFIAVNETGEAVGGHRG